VHRIVARLELTQLYYLERLRRFFLLDELPAGFEPLRESHPSYDPALEQASAPAPPLLPVRSQPA
jgi:hypothetical protein